MLNRRPYAVFSTAALIVMCLLVGCTGSPPDARDDGADGSPTTTAPTTPAPVPTTAPTTTAPVPTTTPTTTAPVPTTAPTTTAPPSPAPSGPRDTHILYTAPVNGTYQIHRMKRDGTDRQRLTNDTTREHHWPRPSPDGTRILFYRAAPGATVNDIDTNALWVMDADGSNQRELIPRGAHGWTRQGHVEWSPDGRTLLMAAGTPEMQLYTTDTSGKNPRKVTNRRNGAIDPSWSPDGRTVLFTGCPDDKVMCWWWDYEVHQLNLGTGVETRLTFDDKADFDPYFSPDGRTIVWLRCTGTFPTGPWSIYRGAAGAGPISPVPVLDDGNVNSNIDFSHDGSTLVFSRHQIGLTTWMTSAEIRLDGSGLRFVGGRAAPVDEVGAVYWP